MLTKRSGHFSLILGSRVINWKRDTTDRPYGGEETEVNREENGVFIPYTGVVYDLNDTWSLYASYTKIFNPQASWVTDESTKPLDPMEGKGYEVGIKGTHLDGRLNSSLAVFKLEQDNFGDLATRQRLHRRARHHLQRDRTGVQWRTGRRLASLGRLCLLGDH